MTQTNELASALTEANIPFTVENGIIEIPRLGFEPLFVEYRQGIEDFTVRTDGPEEDDYFGVAFDSPKETIEVILDYLSEYPGWSPDWPTKAGLYWYLRKGAGESVPVWLEWDGGQRICGIHTSPIWNGISAIFDGHFLPITLPDTTLLEEHLKKLREGK